MLLIFFGSFCLIKREELRGELGSQEGLNAKHSKTWSSFTFEALPILFSEFD
jgi:hypothetical protein